MAQAAGALLGIAGGITGGMAAADDRRTYQNMMGHLPTPNTGAEETNYFNDLQKYLPNATAFSNQTRTAEMNQDLLLREQALPGIGASIRNAASSIGDLIGGKIPSSLMDAFTRAGGASTLGMGMGGSGFGFLNTGLFGARGALGAMQTGMGLLPTLLGTMPNITAPTASQLLHGSILTPQARLNQTTQLRQQQIGINDTLAQMPTSLDAWSAHLNRSSAMLMGAGSGGNNYQDSGLRGGSGDAESNMSAWGDNPQAGSSANNLSGE